VWLSGWGYIFEDKQRKMKSNIIDLDKAVDMAQAEMAKRYKKYNNDFMEGVIVMGYMVDDLLREKEDEK